MKATFLAADWATRVDSDDRPAPVPAARPPWARGGRIPGAACARGPAPRTRRRPGGAEPAGTAAVHGDGGGTERARRAGRSRPGGVSGRGSRALFGGQPAV